MKKDTTMVLAQYKSRKQYIPVIGDFVILSKLFTVWCGVISNFDTTTNEVHIIFGGTPFLLFTMDEEIQKKETKKIPLSTIRNAVNGKFAIQQIDREKNATVWYI